LGFCGGKGILFFLFFFSGGISERRGRRSVGEKSIGMYDCLMAKVIRNGRI